MFIFPQFTCQRVIHQSQLTEHLEYFPILLK
uniref:Uncharacterized protein n=1 Tax=Anguilla anguilla TaxID=7936 RepID=A0A0E9T5D4_ANGAN